MHPKFKLIVISLISTQVVACVKNYDLSPKYNEEEKTLNLAGFSINNINYHRSKYRQAGERGAARIESEIFKSSDHICDQLNVSKLTLNSGYFFNANIYEGILDQYDGLCSIENKANVYFMKCNVPPLREYTEYDKSLRDFKRYDYFAAMGDGETETTKKITISLPNSKCMEEMKSYIFTQIDSSKLRSYDSTTKRWSKIKTLID